LIVGGGATASEEVLLKWAFKGVDVAIVAVAHPLLLPLLMIKVIGKVNLQQS
jgi:hypothetical protein